MALDMTATLPMAYAFFLGIDVARTDSEDAGTVICSLFEKSQQDDAPEYRLDSIRSFDKTADPGEIAEQLQRLLVEAPYTARTSFVVNRASPRGQAIFDALDGLGLPVRAVTMTPSGSRAQRDSEAQRDEGSATDERTMEQDVVAALAQVHRDRTLTIQHRETDEAATLARNLQPLRNRQRQARARGRGGNHIGNNFHRLLHQYPLSISERALLAVMYICQSLTSPK